MGDILHNVLALLVSSIANVTLSSFKQGLMEVKRGCLAWFGFLHLYLLLGIKGVLAALGEGIVPSY